jgi:hypothetical protein
MARKEKKKKKRRGKKKKKKRWKCIKKSSLNVQNKLPNHLEARQAILEAMKNKLEEL